MLSTLIPLIDVMALAGTLVSMMRLVFLINEKHKKNCTTTSTRESKITVFAFMYTSLRSINLFIT